MCHSHYCRRSDQSLLLADLGALLPEHHLQFIQRKGRLRKWVLQYPIFALTGLRGSEHVTLNLESNSESEQISEQITCSDGSHDDDAKDQVIVKPLSRRNTVSEEDVVMVEDLLDNLLEHVLDLIDQVSNLRKQVDAFAGPRRAQEEVGGWVGQGSVDGLSATEEEERGVAVDLPSSV